MQTTQTTKSDPAASALDRFPTIECNDPATLERLGDVPVMSRADVVARVERGRVAQEAWARTSFAERKRVFRALQDHIVAHQEEICRLAARDSGKTMVDAAMGEIFPVCEKIAYLLRHGEKDLRPERRPSGLLMHKAARVEYQPLGVVGVIAPWNFPFHNMFCPTLPALFAGNAVLVKISEWTSWSGADYVEIFHKVLRDHGHSPDLVQLITGYGQTGSDLVTSGVEKIFFTGSPQNGRKVMAAASETLTPVVLELGGKDPMIICDDADLDQAVASAMTGVFTACGQMCVGAERLYVQAGIYDRFVAKVTEQVRALRQGPSLEAAPGAYDCGAMTMPRQLDIVDDLVKDAVQKGARLLAGGRRNPSWKGQFYEPTLLVDVTHEMRITQEEQFGPVMVVMRFDTDADAIRLANDCPYGLGSSVFTKDAARAERIAAQIAAGMTVVNDYGIAYMVQSLPFGGVKISGVGKINGREGLRACTNEKAFVWDRFPIHPAISVYPLTAATFPMFEGLVQTIYGGNLLTRVRGVARLARNFVSVARSRAR